MAKSESTKIEFGYFHDYESEQFAFYRISWCVQVSGYYRNIAVEISGRTAVRYIKKTV